MNKEIDMEADDIHVMLMDDSHSFSATDNTKSQVVANEISGTGYTASGSILQSPAVTQAATTKFDATDLAWASATFSAWHAVIYTGTELIASIDLGGEQAVASGSLTIKWHADGIITLA